MSSTLAAKIFKKRLSDLCRAFGQDLSCDLVLFITYSLRQLCLL